MAFNLTYKTVNNDFLFSPKNRPQMTKKSTNMENFPTLESQKDLFNKFYVSKGNPGSSKSLNTKKGFYNMNRNRTTLYLQNKPKSKKRLGS